ncbi:hypothetical protein ACFX13_032874 [Malus domestica]
MAVILLRHLFHLSTNPSASFSSGETKSEHRWFVDVQGVAASEVLRLGHFWPFKHKYDKSCVSKEEHDYRFDVFKFDIVEHRMYEQFVSAHVSCLRITTIVDQLPMINQQLVQSQKHGRQVLGSQ